MRWVHLFVSMVLFPISLVWYRRDLARGIPPRIYWAVMAAWIALNIVLTVFAARRIMEEVDALVGTLPAE